MVWKSAVVVVLVWQSAATKRGEERVRENYYEGEGLGLGVLYPKFT